MTLMLLFLQIKLYPQEAFIGVAPLDFSCRSVTSRGGVTPMQAKLIKT